MSPPNSFNFKKRIFLDYASSTPLAREVLEAMRPWMNGDSDSFANPSALYAEARAAKEAVGEARKKIADMLSAQEKEIIFTSGGTEGNNIALLGVFEAARRKDFVPHIITTVIEHSSILETCKEIERQGGEVTYLPVSEDGLVSARDVREALRPNTVLVSIAYANNEIGTIQPVKEIGKVIKEWRHAQDSHFPFFHTDACQAGLYMDLNILRLGVDMLTLDGIKMYGPRGMGILYVRNTVQAVQNIGQNATQNTSLIRGGMHPIIFGGGQERGLRSGTENVPAIVGLARAFEISEAVKESEVARLVALRDKTVEKILHAFPHAQLNGSRTERLPNNINICFPAHRDKVSGEDITALDAEFVVISLDVEGIACSYSSSCLTLKEDSSSYVIATLGKPACSTSSLRFTLGRETAEGELEELVEVLKKVVK